MAQSHDPEIHEFLTKPPTVTRAMSGSEIATGAIPADPKDDMVIAAAIESGASYIVSEDQYLRDLVDYLGIEIIGLDASGPRRS